MATYAVTVTRSEVVHFQVEAEDMAQAQEAADRVRDHAYAWRAEAMESVTTTVTEQEG